MKRSINPLIFVVLCSITSCQEKEVAHLAQSGISIVKGRYTIAGTDIPVPNIDVYLYNSGWPVGGYQLVDETVTDSNGYYELTIGKGFTYGEFNDNYNHTGYIASRQKNGAHNSLVFSNNGKTYVQDFEMIPPAWVNVTLRNTSGRIDFDRAYLSSERNETFKTFGPKMTSLSHTYRIFGNIPDSISLVLKNSVKDSSYIVERKKYIFNIPGFMIRDTIIDF